MLNIKPSNNSFEVKPVTTVLDGFQGKFYDYPENISGLFTMRNSTDFQSAKLFAENLSGQRYVIAEIECNSNAQRAVAVLNQYFEPFRQYLQDEQAASREDRQHLNAYERRQEERRDRYSDLALKKRRESSNAFDASHNAVAHIPFGQPILVGHHSEKRHRAVISKSHNLMDKACALSKTADYYDRRADSIGRSGISSDDPDSVIKLTEKVNSLKKAHQMMIDANKIVRTKTLSDDLKKERLYCLGYSEKMVNEIMSPLYGRQGFQPYQLSLSSKAIKVAEGRITTINKTKELNNEVVEYDGFTVQYDTEDNRILICFPEKPSEPVRKLLKRNAFNFSPTRKGAWVRKITPNALSACKYLVRDLEALS